MLHWLAGAQKQDTEPDTTGNFEPPETPAPVFAVRAFKHAIFGTPQTQAKPRRHSNNENGRLRQTSTRPERPSMTRPKSAGDVYRAAKEEDAILPEPVASPTKGILLTPGTGGAKRKTVTFGDHVKDNEEKRPIQSGLPDDCPGKFPSPWVKGNPPDEQSEERKESFRGRGNLTEAFEQAREESARRKRPEKKTNCSKDEDPPKDKDEPSSEAGMFWKAQYDSYRENSQREVRKLIAKQKLAKNFAKDKDQECTDLADQLRQERKKVEKLERRTAELEEQLREMEAQMTSKRSVERGRNPVEKGAEGDLRTRRNQKTEPAKIAAVSAAEHAVPAQNAEQPSEHQRNVPAEDSAKTGEGSDRQQKRRLTRPDNLRSKTSDDIWNQSFGSSSQAPNNVSPITGRPVTSETHATPLKSLNVNTLANSKTRRDSAQPSPPSMERFAKEPLIRQEVVTSPKEKGGEKRRKSPVRSPELPQPSPEAARSSSRSPLRRMHSRQEEAEDLSIPVPASSPFEPNPMLSPPGATASNSNSNGEQDGVESSGSPSPSPKDRIPPLNKSKPSQIENVKPMAAWNAINAPAAGRRILSLTDKSGKEVGLDRIEAAKARLAARGRNVS
ncbi:hypothetical protein KC367_g7412 [Hortaea werneckii]|uniref:Spindle pole body-associated protein cut12 domain-containing protein n=1 Tax=Hortaea werneckii TaxID=91943 RepID=A0A3M7IAY9_HORWE|nr:hypothetical protein KC350_g18329 [Hortaea werneckii]KAI6793119.1 hypothetical protein KC358_g17442 [Hortaea werneckii]KAI6899314.1 hypothetical protein KC348_g17181 [Hortaea werneckii]KAI6925901.1 hypothetical protein KC341_g13123 [Hortaea werneckii]KAI6954901.1 hypothetical protein KC329_g18706 [Hortaea werneckii]